MKLVITRVSNATVEIDGSVHSAIERGLLVLVGVCPTDTEADAEYLAKKAANLRIFTDENDKMNLACADVGGEILAVSNFTLYADCRHGNRPSFTDAARPEVAEPLYEHFCDAVRSYGLNVKTGVFGAHMLVKSINDGPITIVIESGDRK